MWEIKYNQIEQKNFRIYDLYEQSRRDGRSRIWDAYKEEWRVGGIDDIVPMRGSEI